MSKKSVILLFILTFTTGFFIRELLLNISDELEDLAAERVIEQNFAPTLNNKTESNFELIELESSKKAIRGYTFEIVGSFKVKSADFGNYKLIVSLLGDNGKFTIDAGQYRLNADRSGTEDRVVKIGPTQIPVPTGIPLGIYNIGIILLRESSSDFKMIKTKANIEVISYN